MLAVIAQKTRPRWSRVLLFYPFILRFLIILSRRLLNELLTVLDNDTGISLIYLNTEEGVEVTIHIFQIYLKIQKKNTRFSSGFEKSTHLYGIFLSI